MSKRAVVLLTAAALLVVGATVVSAIDALFPGSTPLQIVLVRKAQMQADNANVADARAKLTAGTVKQMAANGRSLVAVAGALPLMFGDTYSSVYPVGTTKFFFKGGAIADFRNAAQTLLTAAEDLVKFADAEDKANVEATIPKLQAACGACHGAFRGQLP